MLHDARGIPFEKGQKVVFSIEHFNKVQVGEVTDVCNISGVPRPNAPQGIRSVEITVKFRANIPVPASQFADIFIIAAPENALPPEEPEPERKKVTLEA